MSKFFKVIGYVLAGVLGLLVVAFIAINVISDDQYKSWLTSAVKSGTGRDLTVDQLSVNLGGSLRVEARGVRMANADWGETPEMATVEGLSANLRLLPLLRGVAEIKAELNGARLLAETNAEGESNWALGAPATAEQAPEEPVASGFGLPLRPLVRELLIQQVELTLIPQSGADPRNLKLDSFVVETPDQNTTLTLAAVMDEVPVALSGDLGPLVDVLDSKSSDVKLEGTIGENVLNVTGVWGPLLPDTAMDVNASLDIVSTPKFTALTGYDVADLGVASVAMNLVADGGRYLVPDLKVSFDGEPADISVEGSIADLAALRGVEITTTATASDLARLAEQLRLEPPLLLPPEAEVQATIAGDMEALSVRDIHIALRDAGLDIKLTGGIENALTADGVNVDLTAKVESVATLSKHAGFEIPDLGGLDLSGRLLSNDGVFSINDLSASLDSEDLKVRVTGGVTDLVAVSSLDDFSGLELSAEAGTVSLPGIAEAFQLELPVALPAEVDLEAKVIGDGDRLTVQDILAVIRDQGLDVKLSGSVGDVLAVRDIDAQIDTRIESLSSLSGLLNTELPATEAITAQGRVKPEGEGEASQDAVSLKAESGGLKVTVEGVLDDLTAAQALDLSVSLAAAALSDLSPFLERDLPEDQGPLSLTGNIQTRPNEYTLDEFKLSVGEQSAKGDVSLIVANEVDGNSSLNGKLEIAYLDLSPFLWSAGMESGEATEAETESLAAETESLVAEIEDEAAIVSDRLFSEEPFPLEGLRHFDADFSVTADRLKLGKTDLSAFEIKVSMQEGLLQIQPIQGLAGEKGTLGGMFALDASNDDAALDTNLVLQDIPMPTLGGGLNLQFQLKGEGVSPAALMGSADGSIIVAVRDGVIPKSLATNFGSGLLSFSGESDTTKLECGIVRMEIEDGLVDFEDKIAAQLTEVTWQGGGDIDLKTERLDAGVVPKPRKGIPISAGTLAGLVHIGGTLKNPKVELDPTDVALKYGKYMAAVSTGGLSLVAELVKDKVQANQDVCEKILDGSVFDELEQAQVQETETKLDDSGSGADDE